MKKYILLLMLLPLVAVSCYKGYDEREELYSGSSDYSGGRSYMLHIANDLIVDNLKALESALYADKISSGGPMRSYDTNGIPLHAKGAVWTVKYISGFEGLQITALGDDSWQLDWDGDYALDGNTFPTRYTLTATCLSTMSQSDHFDWEVGLDGTRTERIGYSCHFWTDKPLWYENSSRSDYWSSCSGLLMMEVFKDSKGIDGSTLQLRGAPSNAVYRHGVL